MRFKNLCLTTFAAVASLTLTGCAQLGTFVQIESPAARNLGFRSEEMIVSLTNTTQYKGDVIAFGKKFYEIYPNETIVASNIYEPHTQNQIPLALVFHDREGRYAGVATRVVDVGSYAQSTSWIVRENDITRFGERLSKPAASAPVYASASHKVKLPREWFNGTTWRQLVNDSHSELRILVNGQPRANIKTGEVYALQARAVYPGQTTQSVIVNVFGFAENGQQTGTWEASFTPQNTGVSASQEVLSPSSLRYQ